MAVRIVFEYWIRTILSSRNISVDELTEITVKYYPDFLEWDVNRCDPRLSISNGNSIVTATRDGSKSVFSKHVIEGGRDKTIRWEIKMKCKGKNSNGMMMSMGMMDAKYIDSADVGSYIGWQNHQIAFGILTVKASRFEPNVLRSCPYRITNGALNRLKDDVPEWDIGDRLKLEFKQSQCSVYLNDHFLVNFTIDLPRSFYLAISPHNKSTVLETTLFEIV